MYDSTNKIFQIAEEMVCGSHANIFLTGKAGTGKTTFLRHIKTICDKNLAVVAPTGVAAINAGGTTIHSFFQLPFAPFNYHDTAVFFSRLKINNERRQVFRQLELLIIDEISMVRADLLDAIDAVLRHFRFRHHEPFGGVQVLMIGDMYQLSPVVKGVEWEHVGTHYDSHYFFDSRVLKQSPPVHIAFDKIYRQQDQRFVDLLNGVRNNNLDVEGIALLQSLYDPLFKSADDEDYVILTTHNNKAEVVNREKLAALKGKTFSFSAKIEGEFADRNFPADVELQLKVGARVMFIKNDTEKVRRYFNGKIGTVTSIEDDKIEVTCKGDNEAIEVGIETWQNIRYGVNKETQAIDEDIVGSFKQYPLRLAWAVTIHKSQGLTFEKVIIDAGAAFAPGQVYVALSRCTNLKGIVLLSQVPQHRLASDSRIVQFAKNEVSHDRLREVLQEARAAYQQKILLDTFTFSPLVNDAKTFLQTIETNKESFNNDLIPSINALVGLYHATANVGERFCNYMRARFEREPNLEENEVLQQKIKGAVDHFKKELENTLLFLKTIKSETDSRLHAKEYNESYRSLFIQTSLKLHHITSYRDGFSLQKYHAAKKNFSAPSITVNAYAAASNTTDQHQKPHPQLYQQLRSLRDEICNRTNSPVYMVASGKTLEELVEYLPQNKTELLRIRGFGKITIGKYGDQFLDIIREYSTVHHLQSHIDLTKTKRKSKDKELPNAALSKKEPTHKISLGLYLAGNDITAIAKTRGLAVSTIESHVAQCAGEGMLDPFLFISKEKMDKILSQGEIIEKGGLTAAKIKFGDDVSYFELKLASCYMKSQTTRETK